MSDGRGSYRDGGRGARGGDPHHNSSSQERRSSSARTPAAHASGSSPNPQSGGNDWQMVKSSKQRKAEERLERQALFKIRDAERRKAYPELYAKGLSNDDVRAIVEARESRGSSFHGGRGGSSSHGGRGRGNGPPLRDHGGAMGARGRGGQVDRGDGNGGRRSGQSESARSGTAPATLPLSVKRKREGQTGVTPPAKQRSIVTRPSDVEAPTYAQASARRKPLRVQEDFPHMLHVYKGKTEKVPLTKPDYVDLSARLRKRVLSYVTEEQHIILRTAFIRQASDGAVMIACRNNETQAWYKSEVDVLEIDGVTYRAWDAPATSHLREARVNVTDLGADPAELLRLIRGFNPDLKGEMKVVRVDVQTTSVGCKDILVMSLDDEMAGSLGTREKPWIIDFGTDERTVTYRGIPALKLRLREAGLAELADLLDKATVTGEEGVDAMDDK
jgi:hypothetical protein